MSNRGTTAQVPEELVARIERLEAALSQAWRLQQSGAKSVAERLDGLDRRSRMASYFFHCPADLARESHPPEYGPAIAVAGEPFPLPPPEARPGYSPYDDEHYLEWGRSDHDALIEVIARYARMDRRMEILDFGCSSGRVLRHFHNEATGLEWRLHGTDIQAYLVEWMRRYFPPSIDVFTGTTFPHLPFADASLDVIYGISVFTHTKYLWDTWLAEFRRVLKPGGLCIQSVQTEHAWRFYHEHRHEQWVRDGHPESMLEKAELDEDYFFYGTPEVSQTFYRREVLRAYWDRYLPVVDILPPPRFSYQDWVVMRKD